MSDRITTPYARLHEHPQGVGDARPTALQIIQDQHLLDALAGKTYVVTGANDTTGLETARALHMTGAKIIITTRSTDKSAKAVKSIVDSNGGVKGGIEAVEVELVDQESVRKGAAEILKIAEGKINGLVCNAGFYAPAKLHTKEGFEHDFAVNQLGHFLLFHLLMPALLAASSPSFASRLVMVASIGHRGSEVHFEDINYHSRPWDQFSAYAQSKTANIYTANYVDRVYGPKGLHAWSLQPGGIDSHLWIKSEEERAAVKKNDYFAPFLKTPAQGAATQVWATVGRELEGKGGKYLESMQEIGEWKGPEERRLDWTDSGYAPFIYDVEKEDRTWRACCEMLGLKSEE